MALLQLTRTTAIVDDDDLEYLQRFSWHTCGGYAATTIEGKETYLHRMLFDCEGKQVDHINGNRLDNRRANLRLVSHQQNQWNTGKRKYNRQCGSAFKGVTYDKRRGNWKAEIRRDGKREFLGTFKTDREAAIAYDARAKELFGVYARLNF